MKNLTTAQMIVRVTGTLQLILGLITWSGQADILIPFHILIGSLLVLALLFISYLANQAKISPAMVIITVVWALILPVWGLMQEMLLPGAYHWVISVSHLLCGIGAIGLAEMLGGQITKKSTSPAK